MSEITLMLDAMAQGENASANLLPLVYEELRRLAVMRMAQESAGQTLQPTALVHEAWLQVAGVGERSWQNRAHFFGAAALALTVGLGAATLMFFRERDARKQAEQAEKREAELRQQAEAKEQINQAAIYVSQARFEDANEILKQIKNLPMRPSFDGVMAYRRVGEWLAARHRWAEAADRFSSLMEIDKLDDWNVVTLDYQACGVLLAKSGQRDRYDQFCRAAISRFGSSTNGDTAGRILKTCLLFPPERALMGELAPMARVMDRVFRPYPAGRFPPWAVIFLSLWEYRSGNYDAADDWLKRVSGQVGEADVLTATIQIIQAMTDYKQGRADQAVQELAPARLTIEARFKEDILSGYRQAYWHDWVFAQILLGEATALIEPVNANMPSPDIS